MRINRRKYDAVATAARCLLLRTQGMATVQIAAELGISDRSVRRHLAHLGAQRADSPLEDRDAVLASVAAIGAAATARRFGVRRQAVHQRLRKWRQMESASHG